MAQSPTHLCKTVSHCQHSWHSGWNNPVRRHCPLYRKKFGSVPGLGPLDVSSTPPPLVTTKNVFRRCLMSPGRGTELLSVRSTVLVHYENVLDLTFLEYIYFPNKLFSVFSVLIQNLCTQLTPRTVWMSYPTPL